ncbi:acetylcholine receptor subunit delta-like isoform X2 [Mya arenaria]|uniref:acetylcholine receptor subunit delta-like isoform X2 n=1 Tax=Mya arenaria TaxID=6604 RepID=UPI0022DF82FB|nr:acetylcholine receptor subunit delta-like isoform X2 [Mya arenaria]
MRNTANSLITILTIASLMTLCQCQNKSDAIRLRTQLFNETVYDHRIRPTNNQSAAIEVAMDLYLYAINELSDSTETLKTTGFLAVEWNDAFLQWDPDDFGGISLYHWPQKEVWKPDIALKNSYLDYKTLGVDDLYIENYNDGYMVWYPFQVFQTTCSMDITNFPFDKHTCSLQFRAWSYTEKEVNILSSTEGIYEVVLEENSAWKVLETSSSVAVEETVVTKTFTLKLQRKPLYFCLTVILPIFMLAILDICVFLLPCGSGEKASYAMTVFLSFAIFLTIVSSTLPQNSKSIAIISVFLIIQTVSSTLITFIALWMLRQNSLGEEVKTWWFAAVIRVMKGRRKRGQVAPIECATEEVKIELDEKVPHKSDQKTVEPEFTMKEVVHFLDEVFLKIFAMLLFLSGVICFPLAYANS